jgi:hypothetical protein
MTTEASLREDLLGRFVSDLDFLVVDVSDDGDGEYILTEEGEAVMEFVIELLQEVV